MNEPATTVAKKRRQIGKYRLIASLGQGGMAKVYLALMAGPAGFNKLLVIKALRDDMSDPAGEFVSMFLEEARLAAQLSHPNVVQTYEVGEADGRYFIAMEYLEGQSLRTVERRLGRDNLPLAESLRILSETARGLHYAHELRGFDGEPLHCVHRDVSPQNVFLTYDGQVKLLDFGIAKTGDPAHDTKVGVIKGKADYIAPEQVRGERMDRRADVFSLGAMLWETLTGQRFGGGPKVSDVTKIHNRVTGAEPMLHEAAPDAPEALQAICEQAIALAPDDRFPTAQDFAEALDAYLESTGEKPSRSSLGALLAPAFEAEREKLRSLIDAQVQLVQSQAPSAFPGHTGSLPSLGPPSSQSSVSISGLEGADVSESGSVSRSGATAAPPSLLDLSGATGESTRDSAAPDSAPAPADGAPRRRWLAWAVAAAAVGLGAFLGASSRERSAPPPATTTQAPSTQAGQGTAPSATPEVDTVRLHITVDVPEAQATLDGAQLPLPFDARVDMDGKLHKLKVSARGHRTLRQVLTFDRDLDLQLELVPRRRSPDDEEGDEEESETEVEASAQAPGRLDRSTEGAAAPAVPRRRPATGRQVVAPGENLIGSTPTRAPPAPRIDVEDPYR